MLLGYLVAALLVFLPAWLHPTSVLIGDGTDGSQFVWFLGWFPFAISHGRNPLITDFLNYPAGANLMWNTSIPLAATVLTPITRVLGPVFAYNLVETLAVALSAWAAYLFIRRYAPGPGAAIGGLLYGFAPYMMAQSLGHPHMTLAFLPPLMLLALDELLIRRARPPLRLSVLLGLMGAAQLLLSEEMLLTTAIVVSWAGGLLILMDPTGARQRLVIATRALLPALITFSLLAALPLGVQFLGPQQVHGLFHERDRYITDLLGFVVPTRMQWLAPPIATQLSARFPGNFSERDAYLGLPMLLVLGWAVRRWWNDTPVRVAALLATLIALFSLGRTLHIAGVDTGFPVVLAVLPLAFWRPLGRLRAMAVVFAVTWAAWMLIPFVGNILPGRLMVYVFLLAGIPLAYFVNHVVRLGAGPRVLGGALAALTVAPLVPVIPYPVTAVSIPAFFVAGIERVVPPDSVALVWAAPGPLHSAMLWQARAAMRFKTPDGYIFVPGPAGPSLTPNAMAISEVLRRLEAGESPTYSAAMRARLLDELQRAHVQTVMAGPGTGQAAVTALFSWLLGRGPDSLGGVAVWPDVQRSLARRARGPLLS